MWSAEMIWLAAIAVVIGLSGMAVYMIVLNGLGRR